MEKRDALVTRTEVSRRGTRVVIPVFCVFSSGLVSLVFSCTLLVYAGTTVPTKAVVGDSEEPQTLHAEHSGLAG